MSNQLLAAFRPEAQRFIEARALTKPMAVGEIVFEPNAPLIHLVFPHGGVVSAQATLQDGRVIEKYSIGRDGVIGLDHVGGGRRFPCLATVLLEGTASWLPVADFDEAWERFECIRDVMTRYSMATIQRLTWQVVCASAHQATQRLATWLLLAYDRSDSASFEITQRSLAGIFGYRLATVSEAIARLSSLGAIDHSRGTLMIVNRAALERAACECYGMISNPIG